jgi:hypothetical protein
MLMGLVHAQQATAFAPAVHESLSDSWIFKIYIKKMGNNFRGPFSARNGPVKSQYTWNL